MKSSGSYSQTRSLTVACAVISFSLVVQAQTYTTLASFTGANGYYPIASFIQATDGNFYSTTLHGGAGQDGGDGVVFSMTTAGGVTDLYSFCQQSSCTDGSEPNPGILLGSDGNLYGTTESGGTSNSGIFFKVTLGGKLTTLYNFSCPNCTGGQKPNGVLQVSSGNFYGTSSEGGDTGSGAIFELTPSGQYRVFHSFCLLQNCVDGAGPISAPIQASNGNLYGTTRFGGVQGVGVVYEITPAGSYRVLYNFCAQDQCIDGELPNALVQDAAGNFYGTTWNGGTNDFGTIFEITRTNQFILLHTFDLIDGANPIGALILANDGNLYGTTTTDASGGGNIFQITPEGVFTVLYQFCNGTSCTGTYPNGLFQGTNGVLYGTARNGSTYIWGEAFSLSMGLSPLVETVPIAGKVGKHVIILGNGLTGSTSVTFNGVPASFSVGSDTYIEATVPVGARTGTVSVVTPTGTLNSNPQFVVSK
jgi:uncharacterized repeat protein (TIGR03803 family)